jgi:hypothetical protein
VKYPGTFRMLRVEPPIVKTPRTYVVTFAPGTVETEWTETFWREFFKGELRPHTIHGEENLTAWLAGLDIPPEASTRALEELRQHRSASLAPVVLSDEQLSRHRLLWTAGAKILFYLSALTR